MARNPERPELLLVKRAAWREAGGWWLDSDNPVARCRRQLALRAGDAGLIEGRVLLRYWPPGRRR